MRIQLPPIGKKTMRKTISVYWPLAVVALLAGAAYLHICGGASARAMQAPLAADEFTAELAHAISYGMINDTSVLPARPMRAAAAMPLAEAS